MHSTDSFVTEIASLLLCRLGLLLLLGLAWLCALMCDVTKPLTIVALKPLSSVAMVRLNQNWLLDLVAII